MKRFILVFLFINTALVAFGQQDKFKYQGEAPSYVYYLMPDFSGELIIDSTSSTALRNRIYIEIDENDQLSINSYPTDIFSFAKDYNYVFTNPDGKDYLPESPEKAMVFLKGIYEIVDGEPENQFKYEFVMTIPFNLLTRYYQENKIPEFDKRWDELDKYQQLEVMGEARNKIIMVDMKDYYEKLQKEMNYYDEDLMDTTEVSWEEPEYAYDTTDYYYYEEETESEPTKLHNLLTIIINEKDEIIVKDEILTEEEFKTLVKEFALNYGKNPQYSETPSDAYFSINKHVNASWQKSDRVNEILENFYNELKENEAQKVFGKSLYDLESFYMEAIHSKYRLSILEYDYNDDE